MEPEAQRPAIEDFSARYVLATGVTVKTWQDEIAAMPSDLYERFVAVMGTPLIGQVGGLHYEFDTRTGIPANTVAVPQHNHTSDDVDELLLMK